MIDVDEAIARVLALGRPLDREMLPIAEAAGRWVAEPVLARRTQPARDLSAMDGYAIRGADLAGPWRVIGESAAGAPFEGLCGTGEAVRIFTGAALPAGAGRVVIQEDVTRDGDRLSLTNAPGEETHIRARGSDFAEGDSLIAAGERLTPARIALAAMGGHAALPVRRLSRVAILSTGNELMPLGTDPGDTRLPSTNAPMLAAMLADLPADIDDRGIVADDLGALTAAFDAVRDHDLIVTTGGASVGDHDLVRPALIAAGASLDFWKVAVRPGKPLMAGKLGDTVVIGLPGNPVSAFVTAHLFVRPMIARLGGAVRPVPPRILAELATDLPAVGPRTDFVRARWLGGCLVPVPSSDSGMLRPLAMADVLIVRPARSPEAPAGTRVEAILIA